MEEEHCSVILWTFVRITGMLKKKMKTIIILATKHTTIKSDLLKYEAI